MFEQELKDRECWWILAAGNSGMETLVENVDRSAVVLVFLSNRLKHSAACRSGMPYSTHCTAFTGFATVITL